MGTCGCYDNRRILHITGGRAGLWPRVQAQKSATLILFAQGWVGRSCTYSRPTTCSGNGNPTSKYSLPVAGRACCRHCRAADDTRSTREC